jgi:hypothetical protein
MINMDPSFVFPLTNYASTMQRLGKSVFQRLQMTITDIEQDIYGSRPGHTNFHKDPIHVGSIQSLPGVTTITMAGDADHARQRRALSHVFSTKALLEQEYIVRDYVNVFSQKMKEFAAKGELVNVSSLILRPRKMRSYIAGYGLVRIHDIRRYWRHGVGRTIWLPH